MDQPVEDPAAAGLAAPCSSLISCPLSGGILAKEASTAGLPTVVGMHRGGLTKGTDRSRVCVLPIHGCCYLLFHMRSGTSNAWISFTAEMNLDKMIVFFKKKKAR